MHASKYKKPTYRKRETKYLKESQKYIYLLLLSTGKERDLNQDYVLLVWIRVLTDVFKWEKSWELASKTRTRGLVPTRADFKWWWIDLETELKSETMFYHLCCTSTCWLSYLHIWSTRQFDICFCASSSLWPFYICLSVIIPYLFYF